MQTIDQGTVLLAMARGAIERALDTRTDSRGAHSTSDGTEAFEWLQIHGSSFVTLTQTGQLRGCIGTLEAHRPLGVDVRENAVAAAFRDPRFAPLSRAEFDNIRVEVSLLSPTEALAVSDEASALAALRPHIDGVVFEYGHYRSTFLPQVWEQLPEPTEFLAHLKRKAGLSMDFWSESVRLSRYTVSKWKEAVA